MTNTTTDYDLNNTTTQENKDNFEFEAILNCPSKKDIKIFKVVD